MWFENPTVTLESRIGVAPGIVAWWVENREFNRSKTKKCTTEVTIISEKLIAVPARLFRTREYLNLYYGQFYMDVNFGDKR